MRYIITLLLTLTPAMAADLALPKIGVTALKTYEVHRPMPKKRHVHRHERSRVFYRMPGDR